MSLVVAPMCPVVAPTTVEATVLTYLKATSVSFNVNALLEILIGFVEKDFALFESSLRI